MDADHMVIDSVLIGTLLGLASLMLLTGIFIFRLIKKTQPGIVLKVGLLVCLLVSVSGFGYLASLNWSLPECYDEDGVLLTDVPECQFP